MSNLPSKPVAINFVNLLIAKVVDILSSSKDVVSLKVQVNLVFHQWFYRLHTKCLLLNISAYNFLMKYKNKRLIA